MAKNNWPYKTHEQLEKAGYLFDKQGICGGPRCRMPILWYTTPKGKAMPLNPDFSPHHASCPDVGDFRKKKSC